MEKTVTIKRKLYVPDNRVEDMKADLAYKHMPGTWFDGWTEKAFQAKWGMSTDEAEMLIGKTKKRRGVR